MKPFRRTLIVKLLGRQPSYGFMVKKLRQIWERKGSIDIFDLENDFYLVNFQHLDDYMEALTGGPWVILDAYLNVARRRPEFSPKNERIDSVVAWVRLPDLPAPLFDKKFLLNLGNAIGKAIRLDVHTAQRARGKFARLCVELDLTKPLIPEFNVEGQVLSAVYESLGMLCTKCGLFGHNRCVEFHRKNMEVRMEVEDPEAVQEDKINNDGEKERWKIVQRNRRPRRFLVATQTMQTGSHFSVLEEVRGEEGNSEKFTEGHAKVLKEVVVERVQSEKGTTQMRKERGSGGLGKQNNGSGEKGSKSRCGSTLMASKAELHNRIGVDKVGKENLKPREVNDMKEGIEAMDSEDILSGTADDDPIECHSMTEEARVNPGFPEESLSLGGKKMLFTAVYASPNETRRSRMWDMLYNISTEITDPWLLAGDFNEIKTPLEQKGGGRICEARCRKFRDWIEDCNLIDLNAQGPFFTWKGPNWEGLDRVYRRLDRCLCNIQWQENFANADIKVVPRINSDHYPLLMNLIGRNKEFRSRPFRFEGAWQLHETFEDMLMQKWNREEEAHVSLTYLKKKLIEWNREVFGRIEYQKRRILNRLGGSITGNRQKQQSLSH
ncbi:hypothetical protein K1719_023267 [Acacia pycnantha]|nr:hypothetical protein K1719_023267 [Acacia pycnantha]